ncbi:LacI family transcriptional regulator [Catellatospora sp. IY07-71]|uniref:LacI family DNA-binding transcriptional regulator n=1 Tax=Catellatospora sp. IY07-71 TaxID=2728827 RepID=UPI001BB3A8AD|nr:LacI family DNA-binding transcriptional regulator [Catellatospora sp. IY07-71]BCJ77426.1 LacI family transcriptional regulator [Catellatospora sp. IY07-71]
MAVSLKDIARRAGVSQATVSNVVNGYRPVGEATRAKVQQAIDELGYTPNLSARHLRRGRTGIIALAIPELNNPYFAELADAAIRTATRRGYTLLLDYTDGDRDKELLVADGFRSQIIDGLILSAVHLDRADIMTRTSETPMVLVGEAIYGAPYDHIVIDNLAASHAAVRHLVALGRRRIAFIGAHIEANRAPSLLRLRGYTEALSAAGLPFDPELTVTTSGFRRGDGAAGMRELLRLPQPPDAVFAFNDLIALGAIRALYEHGLRVPEDVAVIGIDDVEEGRFSIPTLTTISPDKEMIGRLAVEKLLDRVEGRPTDPPTELQPPFRLVIRESAPAA